MEIKIKTKKKRQREGGVVEGWDTKEKNNPPHAKRGPFRVTIHLTVKYTLKTIKVQLKYENRQFSHEGAFLLELISVADPRTTS